MSNLPYPHGTGPGQIGEGTDIDTGVVSGTTAGKGFEHGGQLVSAMLNRFPYAVNENVNHIWSRMKETDHPLAVHSYQQQTSGGEDHQTISGEVWCGNANTVSLGIIFRVTDLSGADIVDTISGDKIEVTGVYDIYGGMSYYRGGFQTDPVVVFNHAITSGTSYLIHYGAKGDLDELKTEALLGLIGFTSSNAAILSYSSMDDAISSAQEGEVFTLNIYPTQDEVTQSINWTVSTTFTSDFDDGGVRIKTNGREIVGYDRASDTVYCWNCSDGSLKWNVAPSSGNNMSAVAIDGNHVYAAVQNSSTTAIYIMSLTDGSTIGTMSVPQAVDSTNLVFDMVSDWTNLYVAQWDDADTYTIVSRIVIGSGNSYTESADSKSGVKLLSLDTNGYILVAAGTDKGSSYDQYLELAMFRAKDLATHWYHEINNDVSSYVDMAWVRLLKDGSIVASYGGTSSSGRVVGAAVGDYSLYATQTWEMNGSWGPVSVNNLGIWYVDWYGGTPRLTAKEPSYGSTWLVDAITSEADEIQPVIDVDEAYLYALVGKTTPYNLRKYRLPVWGGMFRKKVSASKIKPTPVQLIIDAVR